MAVARPTDWLNPEYTEVFKERLGRLEKVRTDEAWPLMKAYYAGGNFVEFIEDWIVTYDPRNVNAGRPPFVPFLLFPKQQDFIRWMRECFDDRNHGLVEKSRDAGASWMTLAFALCLYLFKPGVKVSFGSRKADLVDTLGDPDSLLEKVRIMLRMLPEELRPQGYVETQHARYMKITNPENGAVITGEGGDNIGRGGRSSLYILDEAAFIEKPDRIEAALSANAAVRIDVSTPNGTGNVFYRKRFRPTTRVFTMRWKDDPRKDDAWYAQQKIDLDPVILAQEVDLDYEASAGDTCIHAKWLRSSQELRKWLEDMSDLPPRVAGCGGLDVGAGRAKSVWIPRWAQLVGDPEHWMKDDSIDTAGMSREFAAENEVGLVYYDNIGVGRGVVSALRRSKGVRHKGINSGEKASKKRWPDGKRANERFANTKAELWWTVRDRLRKTHEYWLHVKGEGGHAHDFDDVLLMPDHADLNAQLSVVGYKFTVTGKIQIESKDQLETRGIPSPDFADAFVLTFSPPPKLAKSGTTTGHY